MKENEYLKTCYMWHLFSSFLEGTSLYSALPVLHCSPFSLPDPCFIIYTIPISRLAFIAHDLIFIWFPARSHLEYNSFKWFLKGLLAGICSCEVMAPVFIAWISCVVSSIKWPLNAVLVFSTKLLVSSSRYLVNSTQSVH